MESTRRGAPRHEAASRAASREAELAARGAAHLCTGNCPPPSDDEATVESGEEASEPEASDDCFYEGAAAHERAAQAERLARRVEPRTRPTRTSRTVSARCMTMPDAPSSTANLRPTCSRGWRRRAAGARWTSCMRGKSSARSSGASSVRLVTATRRHIAVMRGMVRRGRTLRATTASRMTVGSGTSWSREIPSRVPLFLSSGGCATRSRADTDSILTVEQLACSVISSRPIDAGWRGRTTHRSPLQYARE